MADKKSTGAKKSDADNSDGVRVFVGGNVTASNIVVGNNNTVTQSVIVSFKPVYQAIENSKRAPAEKADLAADVKEIEDIVQAGTVDESFLTRRLRNLKRMAPDIADVAFAALAGPGAAVSAIAKNIAERVKAES